MYLKTLLFGCLGVTGSILCAQERSQFIYATMEEGHAVELQQQFPKLIDILNSENNLSAVYIHPDAAHELHQKILSHGPGYIFHPNQQEALKTVSEPIQQLFNIANYTISEQNLVHKVLDDVNTKKVEETMLLLEAFGTRYHTNSKANLAVEKIKEIWEGFIAASGRTDISVRIVNHQNTPMNSVILTIKGNEKESEYVIVGGHLDSITNTPNIAPGSDDNASGIATITEIIRVLLLNDFKPQRTTEFMAYAAEEVGLVGSAEIAKSYANQGKNVTAYVQFDMTNYKGSTEDIFISTDSYNSNDLNLYLMELLETYNKTGVHALTYNTTKCNYGCSDHFSWAKNGYPAAFPFEASFDDSSPYIHTTSDKFAIVGNAVHAAKFTKLGLEFVIEAAKSSGFMNTTNHQFDNRVKFYNSREILGVELPNNGKIKSLKIVDGLGRVQLEQKTIRGNKVAISELKPGFYIVLVTSEDNKYYTHKFIVS